MSNQICAVTESLALRSDTKWNKSHLSWYVSQQFQGAARAGVSGTLDECCDIVSGVCGLSFEQSQNQRSADILVIPAAIDGPGKALADAMLPPVRQSVIRLDVAESWTLKIEGRRRDILLKAVMLHELGHSLGMGHDANGSDAVMAPIYNPAMVLWRPRDVARLVKLYGEPKRERPKDDDGRKLIDPKSIIIPGYRVVPE